MADPIGIKTQDSSLKKKKKKKKSNSLSLITGHAVNSYNP